MIVCRKVDKIARVAPAAGNECFDEALYVGDCEQQGILSFGSDRAHALTAWRCRTK